MTQKTNCSDRIKWVEADPKILDRVIEMAWEDRTPFEAIQAQFGLAEKDVIDIMRRNMKPSSFRMWRERVTGRATKHRSLRGFAVGTHKCDRQRHISGNKYKK
ncbi:TIGR03643 family protein [Thermaurantimonas aggregans]|uniref:TIGR03643 family protein n=1 Tax=Thermaurantimonas aggregans TaxID=2173829 RepID=A0A401XMM4_9FLAO|nr:TIGR03643 family protein [Thermaurantimonas aggregans]MCX8147724.1 TIGR03643 family protein [Thermaurantimonas aggregans]GCD78269.1 TIGR03643 family protein [Thermaurantimonas aggregans]